MAGFRRTTISSLMYLMRTATRRLTYENFREQRLEKSGGCRSVVEPIRDGVVQESRCCNELETALECKWTSMPLQSFTQVSIRYCANCHHVRTISTLRPTAIGSWWAFLSSRTRRHLLRLSQTGRRH